MVKYNRFPFLTAKIQKKDEIIIIISKKKQTKQQKTIRCNRAVPQDNILGTALMKGAATNLRPQLFLPNDEEVFSAYVANEFGLSAPLVVAHGTVFVVDAVASWQMQPSRTSSVGNY